VPSALADIEVSTPIETAHEQSAGSATPRASGRLSLDARDADVDTIESTK
jgi:hypothetical protein